LSRPDQPVMRGARHRGVSTLDDTERRVRVRTLDAGQLRFVTCRTACCAPVRSTAKSIRVGLRRHRKARLAQSAPLASPAAVNPHPASFLVATASVRGEGVYHGHAPSPDANDCSPTRAWSAGNGSPTTGPGSAVSRRRWTSPSAAARPRLAPPGVPVRRPGRCRGRGGDRLAAQADPGRRPGDTRATRPADADIRPKDGDV
jgi:hypothetical protein